MMPSFRTILKWVAIAAFIITAGVTSYFLLQLPIQMSLQSSALDLSMFEEATPLFQRLYAVVGITILSGLGAIILLVNQQSKAENQIAEFKVTDKQTFGNKAVENEKESDNFYIGDAEAILSSEKEVEAVFNRALSQVCNVVEASQGAVYRVMEEENSKILELFASYAYHLPEGDRLNFHLGEGLVGQAAKDGKVFNIDTVPEGYIQIFSGLGKATPKHLLVVPIKEAEEVIGMLELASFKAFQNHQILALETYLGKLALKLSNSDNVSLEEAKS